MRYGLDAVVQAPNLLVLGAPGTQKAWHYTHVKQKLNRCVISCII